MQPTFVPDERATEQLRESAEASVEPVHIKRGDAIVQRGETVNVVLDVTNAGNGPALDSFTQIKNGGDANIFIEKGRFKLGELGPGETKSARSI